MERIVSKTKDNKISHKFAIVGYRDFGDAKYSNQDFISDKDRID